VRKQCDLCHCCTERAVLRLCCARNKAPRRGGRTGPMTVTAHPRALPALSYLKLPHSTHRVELRWMPLELATHSVSHWVPGSIPAGSSRISKGRRTREHLFTKSSLRRLRLTVTHFHKHFQLLIYFPFSIWVVLQKSRGGPDTRGSSVSPLPLPALVVPGSRFLSQFLRFSLTNYHSTIAPCLSIPAP
jgi:hypothetical protein